MPSIMYIGRSWSTKNIDATHPDFIRGESRDVTQAWMDRYHGRFGDDYLIEGYEHPMKGGVVEIFLSGSLNMILNQKDMQPNQHYLIW